ncbi:unnamed protein product [Protopolystoma xenopodis]|uniref:Uncharacterized protein n=1 Tax=Protopolystoma xenopodis TaxID=117903 RepID=A0A3S5CHN8_9PLAT|nr:unnamed protein product [Protopolystoma xenopodis]
MTTDKRSVKFLCLPKSSGQSPGPLLPPGSNQFDSPQGAPSGRRLNQRPACESYALSSPAIPSADFISDGHLEFTRGYGNWGYIHKHRRKKK